MLKTIARSSPRLFPPARAAALALIALSAFTAAPALAQADRPLRSVGDVKSILAPTVLDAAREVPDVLGATPSDAVVVVRGYIPKASDGIAADRAEFTLASTPEPVAPDASPAPSLTVRIAGAGGEPIKGALAGQHGVRPGAEVFAEGTIARGADGRTVLTARRLHIPRDPLPANLFAPAAPAEAQDISAARSAGPLKVGQTVTLRGRVGGSEKPFVAGRAVLTLVGRGILPCNEKPDDHCATPWDYCCDPRDVITANSVTVQVVDAQKRPLRTDLKGRRGIKELTEITVTGVVAAADTKAVVVNATELVVTPEASSQRP